jgi:hypothetical protein
LGDRCAQRSKLGVDHPGAANSLLTPCCTMRRDTPSIARWGSRSVSESSCSASGCDQGSALLTIGSSYIHRRTRLLYRCHSLPNRSASCRSSRRMKKSTSGIWMPVTTTAAGEPSVAAAPRKIRTFPPR